MIGDPYEMPPPESRIFGRNSQWLHIFAKDVLSMPDKWEYPWFAAWDLAFHMVPYARIDPYFAKAAAHGPPARMVHAPQRPDSQPTNGSSGT